MVGAIRNPEGHRDQQLKREDAIGQILTVNLLLRKLKNDFPERFQKEKEKIQEAENSNIPNGKGELDSF